MRACSVAISCKVLGVCLGFNPTGGSGRDEHDCLVLGFLMLSGFSSFSRGVVASVLWFSLDVTGVGATTCCDSVVSTRD